MEPSVIATVLDRFDRLIGLIDGRDRMIQSNARARDELADPLPAPLLAAADAVRKGGAHRHTVLHGTTHLQGFFWPMPGDVVGFAMRSTVIPTPESVGEEIEIEPWQARRALAAAQRLSDHNIAVAFATHGSIDSCIDYLARSLVPPVVEWMAPGGRGRRVTPPQWRSSSLALDRSGPAGPLLDRSSYLRMPPEVRGPRGDPTPVAAVGPGVLCVVAEDDRYGELLAQSLREVGCRVTLTSNLRAARELVRGDHDHVAVMIDLDLPARAAHDLAAMVRRRSDARIGFYTDGSSSADSIADAGRFGPVLAKAWHAAGLDEVVEVVAAPPIAPSATKRVEEPVGLRAILAALRRKLNPL